MTFEDFMEDVDAILMTDLGIGHYDLPDYLWRDAYDDGYTPRETVDALYEEVGLL